MLYDFVAIDFETACSNNNSACSLGLVAVKNMEIVETNHFLIHPPGLKFDDANIKIHGITPEDVVNAPFFFSLWYKIKHYFDGNIIVAHNAAFDMSVLKCCLIEYEIDIPNFTYMCSMQISDCVCGSECMSRSLMERARYFDINLENHHNALCDAVACAKLVIASMKEIMRGNLQSEYGNQITFYRFSDLTPVKFLKKNKGSSKFAFSNRVSISEVAATTNNFDKSHAFYGKNVVFTGELISMERKDAMQKVLNLGGILKSSVSSKTDFLIVGVQDRALVGEDGMSSKEEKAYLLKEQGHSIQIINEEEFIELTSNVEI